jgi:hypothetical protein
MIWHTAWPIHLANESLIYIKSGITVKQVSAYGGDPPARLGASADGERLSDERRVVAHLDRSVKTVAIAVDDLSHCSEDFR